MSGKAGQNVSIAHISGQLVELQLAFLCGLHGGAIGNSDEDGWCPGMVFVVGHLWL